MERRQYWALGFLEGWSWPCVTVDMTPHLNLRWSVPCGGQVYINAQPRIESWFR
jgi:hypothetical protein